MKKAEKEQESVARRQREQMLKLVTKGFYNELINYGVATGDILTIASHLLDNVMQQADQMAREEHHYHHLFNTGTIRDHWKARQRLEVDAVSVQPMQEVDLEQVVNWVSDPKVRDSFITPYPEDAPGLARYFSQPGRLYFAIAYEDRCVGIIGAENIDRAARRLEMRKLVGNRELRGRGIGKRATFAFLYYVFKILEFEKVYIHSTDVNIRNLNLNSHFGFQLEGVLLQEIQNGSRRQDVVRMGLMRSHWLGIFEGEGTA
jgi:RimJ/RimL family protein N-acetyltransferase